MNYLVGILLVSLLSQCKENTDSHSCTAPQYIIDTSGFDLSKGLFLKNYYRNGTIEFARLYEDSVRKDLCRFCANGRIEQYVFFNEHCDCPKLIINYDSLGCEIDTLDGELVYFKSTFFGNEVNAGDPYSVYVYSATPPKMKLHFSLYSSPNNNDWNYFGKKEFENDLNSSVIADTVSHLQQYFMGVCNLKTTDGKEIIKNDTVYYSLNIR